MRIQTFQLGTRRVPRWLIPILGVLLMAAVLTFSAVVIVVAAVGGAALALASGVRSLFGNRDATTRGQGAALGRPFGHSPDPGAQSADAPQPGQSPKTITMHRGPEGSWERE